MSEPTRRYRRPPITEAVIGFQFSAPIPDRELERFAVAEKRSFPRREQVREISVKIGEPSASAIVGDRISGVKLLSEDSLAILMVFPKALSVCRLAPYTGWDDLVARARDVWDDLTKIVGFRPLDSLSTRYINRIDVPTKIGLKPQVSDYLTVGVVTPEAVGNLDVFSLNARVLSDDGRFQHVINAGIADPVLIDHTSFLLDIDTITVGAIPNRPEERWNIVAELQHRKNKCFELCITDEARRLFQ